MRVGTPGTPFEAPDFFRGTLLAENYWRRGRAAQRTNARLLVFRQQKAGDFTHARAAPLPGSGPPGARRRRWLPRRQPPTPPLDHPLPRRVDLPQPPHLSRLLFERDRDRQLLQALACRAARVRVFENTRVVGGGGCVSRDCLSCS
jgi:hypothetical protein